MEKRKSKKEEKLKDKTIIENIPSEGKWLLQPTNITFLRGAITPKQWNMMLGIIEVLQDNINNAIQHGSRSIFADEEIKVSKNSKGEEHREVIVQVPISAFTTNPQDYRLVDELANRLMEFHIAIDKVGKEGKKYTELIHLIDKIRIEKRETTEGKKAYRTGMMEFVLTNDQIDYLYNLNPLAESNSPYSKYLKSVVTNSKSIYTSRIYMFLTAYRAYGTWTPLYENLHKIFGFTEWKDGKWVKVKYPSFRQFRDKVLNDTQAELHEMAERGEVDCEFTYDVIYPLGKKRGEPEKIRFHIITTKFGIHEEENTKRNKKLIEIEGMLRNDFECTTTDVKQLSKLITADNCDYCLNKMEQLKKYIEEHKQSIDSVRKYAIITIKNTLMDLIPSVEEVKQEHDAPQQEQQSPGASEVPSDYMDMFASFLNGVDKMWTDAFTLMEITDTTIVIQAPSKATVEVFNKEAGGDFWNKVEKEFGKKVVIKYQNML